MSDKIRQFVSNVMNGDLVDARHDFDDLLSERIMDRLADEKLRVSGVIYNGMTTEDFDEDLDEDTEYLDELSKKTLGSYVKKADKSVNRLDLKADTHRFKADDHADKAEYHADEKGAYSRSAMKHADKADHHSDAADRFDAKSRKRTRGISLANRKMAKEGYLDELSKKTLGSYTRKAAQSAGDIAHKMGTQKANADDVDRFTNRHMKNDYDIRDKLKSALGADDDSQRKSRGKFNKRMKGISRATDRLTKEEYLDELSKETMGRYAARAINDVRNSNRASVRFANSRGGSEVDADSKMSDTEKMQNRKAKNREKGLRRVIKKTTGQDLYSRAKG